jgi:CheY-like chemotaxis protein
VEDEGNQAQWVSVLLKIQLIEVQRPGSAKEAVALLDADPSSLFSCMVLDLGLPDMDGLELLEVLSKRPGASALPVVVYTGRALSRTESERLDGYSEAVVLKGTAGPTRVVDEVRNFTQRFRAGLRPSARNAAAARGELRLDGQRILLADDDMRTVYAVSALLRGRGAEVLVADTGRSAVSTLEHQSVDALLLDLTMPELDGFGVLAWLQGQQRLAGLPVIVLTAKVIHGDRQKCLDAGASDYLAKPVDGDSLIESLHALLNQGMSSAAAGRTVN